jgi:hypothetical protein
MIFDHHEDICSKYSAIDLVRAQYDDLRNLVEGASIITVKGASVRLHHQAI